MIDLKKIFLCLLLCPVGGNATTNVINRAELHRQQVSVPDQMSRATSDFSQSLSIASPEAADLRISEISSPAHFTQDQASIAKMKNGQWISVWQDERSGANKIFMQLIDSLGPLSGVNQLLIGSNSGAELVDPKVAVDTSGRVFLFYRDRTNGLLFGTRYTSALAVDLAPFLVNDTTNGAFAGLFDFDLYPDGRLVAVWENYDISGNTIKMRIYSNTGASVITPTTVNSDAASNAHWAPDVAVQPNSGYVVAWEDYRSVDPDIYVSQYTGAGTAVAAEFTLVPPAAADSLQYAPQVVFSTLGNYTIGWIDLRVGQEIYLQTFNPTTGLTGGNVLASSGNSSLTAWDIDLAVAPNSTLLACWASYGVDISIVSRRFSTSLLPLTSVLEMYNSSVGRRWSPAAEFFSANRYGIAWTEFASEDADVKFLQFDTLGGPLMVSARTLNDDSQGNPATSPSIINASNWRDLVVFADRRNDIGDVFVQMVAHDGTLYGPNRKLNADNGANLQSEPSAAEGDTSHLAIWVDGRAISGVPGQRVFVRYLSDYGNFLSNEFAVSDSLSGDGKAMPRGAIAKNGRALVAWIDSRGSSPQVYGRWLTTTGQIDGAEFPISASASDSQIVKLQVGRDAQNRFYVLWFDNGRTTPRVRGAWYNADKSAGGTFGYSSTVGGANIDDVAAAINDSGAIGLLWTTSGSITKELYLTVISRTSAILQAATLVTDNIGSLPSEPTIDFDEQGYVGTGWVDRRSGTRQFYYRIYSNLYAPLAANQPFSATTPEFMRAPSLAASHGRLWAAWVDPRTTGAAIWGNVYLYLATDVADDNPTTPPIMILGQNFPNPFNPSTEITFSLPTRSEVRLTVYNLLGQQVTTLVNGSLSSGGHRVMWNGRDAEGNAVGSGVYFYRLDAGNFSQTKKMLLVK
jgi:hypothetical protein